MKILLIDDDKELTSMLKYELEGQNFVVEVAYDGNVGRKLVCEKKYDLIILDIMLLGIDGFELYKKIRNELDAPVLMISSINMIEYKMTEFNNNTANFLQKPFSITKLLSKMNSLVLSVKN